MSTYTPDRWVIVKITSPEGVHYRVLASWYGGYLGSDSWKMSSGITLVQEYPDRYQITNASGSIYMCSKLGLGTSGYTQSVFNDYEKRMYNVGSSIQIISTEVEPLGNLVDTPFEHYCCE